MDIEAEFLIVGTGPAGSALACFLASHGMKGLMIGATRGSITTPRAHITNAAALECLRDIGLETEANQVATDNKNMMHTRWCYSMAGEEFGRIYSWANAPARKGEYYAASPCKHVDIPQSVLEPILVRYATRNGITCRFDTSFVSFSRSSPNGPITSTLRDNLTGHTYTVRSKYLFGCDGARSEVLRQLNLTLIKKPGQGLAMNVLLEADLSKVIETRTGNLHWVFQPDREHPDFGWGCIVRMVKPWHEWMFIFFPTPGTGTDFSPSHADYVKRCHEFIGDDTIPVRILDISKWYINEIVAERYSDGNIFCLGDAVHRHPPINGLGSNTCIQDAFNLAWKVAYVSRGLAGPSLLATYSTERQPVGATVIARANQGLRDHVPIWTALGMMEPDLASRTAAFEELWAASDKGRARRAALQAGIDGTEHEFHALGVEMNQRYESAAVFAADESGPRPALPEDAVLHHQISTYPGARLPHAWLNRRVPGTPVSTIDLAGHGAFTVLTGIGGERWKECARAVSAELGVEVRVFSIGWGCDWEDPYGEWAKRREVQEDGCVLVRPDRFVCWRSHAMMTMCRRKLMEVMCKVLARQMDTTGGCG